VLALINRRWNHASPERSLRARQQRAAAHAGPPRDTERRPRPHRRTAGGAAARLRPGSGSGSSAGGGARRRLGMAEAREAGPEAAGDGAAEERVAVIGATVPTGFEVTAAAEVQEKLGSASRISRDRGKIYFEVPARSLPEVRGPTPAPLGTPGTARRGPADCGHRRCVWPRSAPSAAERSRFAASRRAAPVLPRLAL